MPITAIEITNLFCGHRVRHCFRPKCFIYKTFFSKSQASWEGFEPPTNSLEVNCSIQLSYQDVRDPPVCASLRGMGGAGLIRSLDPRCL